MENTITPSVFNRDRIQVNQVEKKKMLLDTILVHPGHRFFELNVKTLEFIEVFTTDKSISITGDKRSKINMKEGHLYCSALNRKSAEGKFIKMLHKIVDKN